LVIETGGEITRSAQDQISDVVKKVESLTSESSKQADSVLETYQLALVSMESFHTYSRELLEKGRPSDITRAACELHDRATELLGNDVTAVKYHPPHVTFTPADVTYLNLIGKLTITTENQPGKCCLLSEYVAGILDVYFAQIFSSSTCFPVKVLCAKPVLLQGSNNKDHTVNQIVYMRAFGRHFSSTLLS